MCTLNPEWQDIPPNGDPTIRYRTDLTWNPVMPASLPWTHTFRRVNICHKIGVTSKYSITFHFWTLFPATQSRVYKGLCISCETLSQESDLLPSLVLKGALLLGQGWSSGCQITTRELMAPPRKDIASPRISEPRRLHIKPPSLKNHPAWTLGVISPPRQHATTATCDKKVTMTAYIKELKYWCFSSNTRV